MFAISRFIYSLFITLALPVIFARLLLRSIKVPAYRQRLLERLGIYPDLRVLPQFKPEGIWIHAVSVGEVVAALPLIKALQANYPAMSITLTTTTPTGSQRVKQSLGNSVTHVYMPYDTPWAIANLVRLLQPRCLIIMETELWPNLLHACHSQRVPIIVANGRISDRSLQGYSRIKWFVSKLLQQVTFVAAQSQMDSERFVQLGLAPQKVQTAGNLKFEVQVSNLQQECGNSLKESLSQRLVLVAASTHANEEEQILAAFKVVRAKYPHSLLILVPRHPDRFDLVADLIQQQQLSFIRRSSGMICDEDTQVLLGDTMGELYIFYAAADIAFVGGSLVPIGGHNLLEPAALGVPSITGPHVSNFKEIAMLLQKAGSLQTVHNVAELTSQILAWFGAAELRQQLGARSRQVIEQNRGATNNLMLIINDLLVLDKYFSEPAAAKN